MAAGRLCPELGAELGCGSGVTRVLLSESTPWDRVRQDDRDALLAREDAERALDGLDDIRPGAHRRGPEEASRRPADDSVEGVRPLARVIRRRLHLYRPGEVAEALADSLGETILHPRDRKIVRSEMHDHDIGPRLVEGVEDVFGWVAVHAEGAAVGNDGEAGLFFELTLEDEWPRVVGVTKAVALQIAAAEVEDGGHVSMVPEVGEPVRRVREERWSKATPGDRYTDGMRITKLHGLGNDYIYVRPAREDERDWEDVARRVSDRHFGIGADGLILALPSEVADLKMRIFNADGSEAEMCGNGIRCVAKYAVEEGMVAPDIEDISIETGAGVLTLQLFREGGVVSAARVNMGQPRFEPAEIPVNAEGPAPIMGLPLEVGGMHLNLTLVSMGNPHAIHYITDGLDEFPLERIGPMVENHPLFPRRTNFQVVQVVDRGHVLHRVWERGSGITLASGTSASAVCVASRLHGFTGDRIVDSLPGGDLVLEWDGTGPVFMTGPATRVFDGEWLGA